MNKSFTDELIRILTIDKINTITKIALEINKEEFAPGIPIQRKVESIPHVREEDPNKEWTISLSRHPAIRRGTHLDMRLIDSKDKAHSWALINMPKPGGNTYAIQQPTHTGEYARIKKPFAIPSGYGATKPGTSIEPVYVQPTEIISASDDRVHFLRHQGQQTEEFVLRKLIDRKDKPSIWMLKNDTKTRETTEGKQIPDFKPRYKDADLDQIDLNNNGQLLTAKIDGAHTIVDFPKTGRMMRVYSYRPTTRQTGLIEHTFKLPNFHKNKVPKELQGTTLRTEAWASDQTGKAIPASELGGLLNSSVPKSRIKQDQDNLRLRLTGIDVVKYNNKDYSNRPYTEKLKIIKKVNKLMKGLVELPVTAFTPKQKKELITAVKTGKLAETKEGVVVHELHRTAPFQRAKIRPDHDVYVRGVETKKSAPKGQASAFTYSFEPDGKIIGRIGTGLNKKLRIDMHDNPDKYIGRVAKVRSAGQHQKRKDSDQGALIGSPAFKEWHIDKTPPELLEPESSK